MRVSKRSIAFTRLATTLRNTRALRKEASPGPSFSVTSTGSRPESAGRVLCGMPDVSERGRPAPARAPP